MSRITTTCSHCQKKLRIDERFLDKAIRCPSCNGVFKVESVAFASPSDPVASQEALVTQSQPNEALTDPPNLFEQIEVSQESLNSRQANDSHSPAIKSIGRYEIEMELGRGAFGTVFAAHDPVLKRNVAIKLPHDSLKSDEYEKVLQEARAAARLRHPNIVSVFEVDSDEGRPFVVTELIDGQTLADRIAVGPIEPNDAATMARDLALGLAYSHSQGLVHRDIKPQNVLIGKDGRPQIADFGLAVDRRDESKAREQAYSRSGTLAYMAPEQAGIGGASVGPAADQYALGATLFEMLTGKRPHVGSSIEIFTELEKPTPPRARKVRSTVPLNLDAICAKAMAHEPWTRYEDCTELAEDLNRYLRGELIRGRKIGLVERAKYFSKKNPRLAAWTTAGAVIAGCILLISTYSIVRTVIQYRYLAGDSTAKMTSIADGKFQADRTNWLAYSRKLNKAARSMAIGEYDVAEQLLAETKPELRNWEFEHLADQCSRHIAEWPIDIQTQKIFPLSDGKTVAILVGQKEIQFRSISTGEIASTWNIPSQTQTPAPLIQLMETQPVFAFLDGTKLRFWNYTEKRELLSMDVDFGGQQIKSIQFSPDDRWFAIVCFDSTIRLWDVQRRESVTPRPFQGQKIVFPPDSKCAFIESVDQQLIRLSLPELQLGTCAWFLNTSYRESLQGVSKSLMQVIALRDQQSLLCGEMTMATKLSQNWIWLEPDVNNRLAAVADGNSLRFFRNGDEKELQIPKSESVRLMAMSNNGKVLFATSASDTNAMMRVWDTEQISPISLHGMGLQSRAFASSRDGKQVAVEAGGRILVFDTESWNRKPSANFESAVSSLTFHPSGKMLASGHENGTVRIWNSQNGTETKTIPSLGSTIGAMAYSNDGEMLAVGMKQNFKSNQSLIDVIVLSASSGTEIQRFGKHTDSINSIAFDDSGRQFVTSGDDGKVLLWSIDSPEPKLSFELADELVKSAIFSRDNKSIFIVATPYRTETRTREFATTVFQTETRSRMITKSNMKTEIRTGTRRVDFEGKEVVEPYSSEAIVPLSYTEEVMFTVNVPRAETRTESYTIAVPKTESGAVIGRPRLIRLSASSLKPQAQWIPEAERTPRSLAFSADGNRLFVSTNSGISVLNPEHMFELIELKTGTSSENLSEICVDDLNKSLHALNRGQLISFKDIPTPNQDFWNITAEAIREYPINSRLAVAALSSPDGKPNQNVLTNRRLEPYQPPADTSLKKLAEISSDVESVLLNKIDIDKSQAGLSPEGINEMRGVRPITLDGLSFDNGLFAHADSRYKVTLTPEWTTFTTRFGLHDRGYGSVVFAILGDSKPLYRSSLIRDHRIHGINLDVHNIKELELVVLHADDWRKNDFGVWLEPTLHRNPVSNIQPALAGVIRLTGDKITLAKFKLSNKGIEATQIEGDPIFRINDMEWRPNEKNLLPNEGDTKFFSDDIDYLRTKLDLYGADTFGNVAYSTTQDSLELILSTKTGSLFKSEIAISMPRKEKNLDDKTTVPNWTNSWKVAGYALKPLAKNADPNEPLPPKGIKPFAVKEFDSIDWSWWDTDCPLGGAPKDHFVVVGERKLESVGGIYRLETLADDGIRVKVDGVTVIDNWQNQCITHFARLLTLAPGEHKVRFEYFEGTMVSRLSVNLRCIEPATAAGNRLQPSSKD